MSEGGLPPTLARWEDPDIVADAAGREADHRLQALLEEIESAGDLRVLDLGCAGGRNAVLLAARGCDLYAVDLSQAMVDETRRRLAPLVGPKEAIRRVLRGTMEDLSRFAEASFDLVIALGIYHQATSVEPWDRAVAESARVLRLGGRLLVAHFAPGTDLTGKHGQRLEEQDHVYWIRDDSPAVLLDSAELDRRMQAHALEPVAPTAMVERPHDPAGRRVTTNALYRYGRVSSQ